MNYAQASRTDPKNEHVHFELFNGAGIDYRLKFDQSLEIRPCGWFSYNPDPSLTRPTTSKQYSNLAKEFHVTFARGMVFPEIFGKTIPMHFIRCFGYDIECIGTDGRFPRAQENEVISISMCFHVLEELQISNDKNDKLKSVGGQDKMVRYALQLGSLPGMDSDGMLRIEDATPTEVFTNVEAPSVATCYCFPYETDEEKRVAETKLLSKFIELYEVHNPHIMITYNGNGFDTPYILERAERLGIGKEMRQRLGNGSSACRREAPLKQIVAQKHDKCKDDMVPIGRGLALAPDTLVCVEKEVSETPRSTGIEKMNPNYVFPMQRGRCVPSLLRQTPL